jgi:DHA2 family multidrug resistance protein
MPIQRSPRSAAKPGVSPWLVAFTISLATFMEVLDTSIANVALPHIAGNLGASEEESTWVLTSYLVSNAIIIPISGWLSRYIGRKRFYMTCVAAFTVSSFLCGIAPSLGFLLFFRVLQGAGGGGMQPVSQAMLADTFIGKDLAKAFAVYGVAVVVAPALGPAMGGWITDNFSWRFIFLMNIPVGLLSLALTYSLVQDPPGAKEEQARSKRVDYIGFAFTALAFGALQIMFDKGQEDDWFTSPFITGMATIAGVGLIGLVLWETLVEPDPIVDLRLLSYRNLSTSMFLQFVVGFILNSTTVLIPQFVQTILGYDATDAGLVLMPGGITLMVMMPIASALAGRMRPKYLMAIGLIITAVSMFMLTGFNTEVPFRTIAWMRALQCVGLPLFFIPLSVIAYSGLPPGKNDSASSMMSLMRNLGGGIGISVATTLIFRRTQMHQTRLAERVTQGFAPVTHYLNLHGGLTQKSIDGIYAIVLRQAAMLSYLDAFQVFAWGTLIVVATVLVLRQTPSAAGEVAIH